MALIRAQKGLLAEVARALGLTRAAVVKWTDVPAERVIEIERITGIPREALRPDLYTRHSPITPRRQRTVRS
jgi:DNA-binding transcriptional regulator YdaS (Cro superfamily)